MVVRVLRVLKNRAAGSIAPTGSFADRRSVCVGADDFHRPGNAAIAGNFAGQSGHWTGKAEATGSHRGGRERPPYNPPQMGAGERNVGRKGKVSGFACRLPCIVGRAISPAGQPGGKRKAAGKRECAPKHCSARQLCGTMQASSPTKGVCPLLAGSRPFLRRPKAAGRPQFLIPHSELLRHFSSSYSQSAAASGVMICLGAGRPSAASASRSSAAWGTSRW